MSSLAEYQAGQPEQCKGEGRGEGKAAGAQRLCREPSQGPPKSSSRLPAALLAQILLLGTTVSSHRIPQTLSPSTFGVLPERAVPSLHGGFV